MNVHELRFLLSQRGKLERLIEQSSPENVIGRMSLESRLRQVEEELETYSSFTPALASARLTFWGRPVQGSRGISADFGTEAVRSFSRAVTYFAVGKGTSLPARGRIPGGSNYRVMITGVAHGSFSFNLEDASQQPAFAGLSTPVELAIDGVKGILEASVGIDEDLAEAIGDTDKRTLNAIRAFLKKVADSSAVCSLEFKGDVFQFRDTAQVRRSERRLSRDNIQEDEVEFTGYFAGFLPNSRRAEFYITETDATFLVDYIGEVLTGTVDPGVDEQISINGMLDQIVRIYAWTRRVGEGRPRYFITSCTAQA